MGEVSPFGNGRHDTSTLGGGGRERETTWEILVTNWYIFKNLMNSHIFNNTYIICILGLDIQAMSNRVISSNPQSLATSKDKFFGWF